MNRKNRRSNVDLSVSEYLLPLWFFRIVGCIGEREAPPTLKLKKLCYYLFYGFNSGLKMAREMRRIESIISAFICVYLRFPIPGQQE